MCPLYQSSLWGFGSYPPLPRWNCLSFSVFLCVAGRAFLTGKGGGGGRSQIIRWWESLVLYNYSTLSYLDQRTNKQQLWNNLTYILHCLNIRGQYVEHTTNVGQRGDTRSKHNISQPEGMKLFALNEFVFAGIRIRKPRITGQENLDPQYYLHWHSKRYPTYTYLISQRKSGTTYSYMWKCLLYCCIMGKGK